MAASAPGPSASPPGAAGAPTAPASPTTALPATTSALVPHDPQSNALNPSTNALTPALSNTNNSNNALRHGTNTSNVDDPNNTTALANNNTNYNSMNSMYGGGMGMMDPYGMGMGYGGMGYGGMGMGGMGMMGMGGMGMMGMGMYGMTPEAQRAQMMMMMTNSIMQLWGMFSQVLQMTLGSAVQFVGEYVGINQRLGQIEEEHLNLEERYQNRKYDLRKALSDIPKEQRYVSKVQRVKKPKQPSFFRRFIVRLLRHVALFVVAYFLARQVAKWVAARSGKKLVETSASKAFSGATKLS